MNKQALKARAWNLRFETLGLEFEPWDLEFASRMLQFTRLHFNYNTNRNWFAKSGKFAPDKLKLHRIRRCRNGVRMLPMLTVFRRMLYDVPHRITHYPSRNRRNVIFPFHGEIQKRVIIFQEKFALWLQPVYIYACLSSNTIPVRHLTVCRSEQLDRGVRISKSKKNEEAIDNLVVRIGLSGIIKYPAMRPNRCGYA